MRKDVQKKDVKQERRKLLKAIGIGSGVATAAAMKEHWHTPIVKTVMLPVHAEATFAHTCEISDIEVSFEASKEGTEIPGTYTGTQFAAGPFFGDCQETGFEFSELGLTVIIEPV